MNRDRKNTGPAKAVRPYLWLASIDLMSARSPQSVPDIAPPAVAAILPPLASAITDFRLLQSHRLLKGIPPGVLQALVEKCERVAVGKDEVLLRPGQANHILYFLLSGQLAVHLDSRDSSNGFSIEPGEAIGEMSIIEQRPAAAWVVGKEPSLLLAMPEQVFWDEFLRIPQATRNLLLLLISRVRKTDAVLVKELEKKIRYELLQRELKSAAKIQTSILPSSRPLFPNHPQVQVHALMRPAREVGGDFFDAFALNDHSVCVAVGDVCGKGMPAALFMVRVVTLLRMCVLQEKNPAAILPAVNRLLYEANEESMFVTLAVAIVDTRTGRLTYLNGGHNPPFLAVNGQPFQIWTPPTAALLGFDPDATFSTSEMTLGQGDTLVLYTDGVNEAENSSLEQFTVGRAAEALTKSMPKGDVVELVEQLAASVGGFAGEREQSDDITILALRYQGRSAESPTA